MQASRDENLGKLFEETVASANNFYNDLKFLALLSYNPKDYLENSEQQIDFTNFYEKLVRLKNEFILSEETFQEITYQFQKSQDRGLLISMMDTVVDGKNFGVKWMPENPYKLLEIMEEICVILKTKYTEYKKRNLNLIR